MYSLIDNENEVLGLCHEIMSYRGSVFADIESTGLDWFVNDILLFQIKIDEKIYIIDVRSVGYPVFAKFIQFLESSGNTSVFHNAKFDLKFIYHRTNIMLSNVYDTMTSEAVLNSGKGKTFYSLEELAEKYADIIMDKTTRLEFVDYPKDMPFTERQLHYAALDVQALQPIYEQQWEQFYETKQDRVAILEAQLIPIVARMEYDGIRLDTKMWLEIEKECIIKRDNLTEEFKKEIIDFLVSQKKFPNALELVKATHLINKSKFTKKMIAFLEDITDFENLRGWLLETFNPKSPAQLLEIFHLMGIKCKNTNEKTLNDFRKFPIVERLISIREVNKQIDQYGSNFLKNIHRDTGKIHTEYFTVGTQTGRFSSNNPNLQNIPTHGGYRECFLPEEGYLFAAVDYSQQEYRLAGAVTREDVIIEAYKSGSDMHTATGKIVAKKDVITPDERNRGKTVNFAILYGSTEWGLKKNLRIDIDEAKEIIRRFWEGYPKLAKFMEYAGNKILELGYSKTPLGRRRYNVEKPVMGNSDDFVKWRDRVLREGKNHIIQGGGADILKIAMVEINARNPFGDGLKFTLQIHDEIVCQVRKEIAEEALKFIIDIMEEVEQRFLGEIPAKADGKLKERWSK